MRVAIFSDAGSAMGGCRSCRPFSGIDFGDFGAMTWEEFITANPQCAGKRPATYAVQGFEAEGDPLPYMDSACQKAWEAAGSPLPTTPSGYRYKQECASSASQQGLSPATGGDKFADLIMNYSKEEVIMAIAWGEYRDPSGNVSDSARIAASAVLASAMNGDCVAQATATRSAAFWAAAGKPTGGVSLSTIKSAADAAQRAADELRAQCEKLPAELRGGCQKAVDAAQKKADDLAKNIPSFIPGETPPPESEAGVSAIPWWAWVAGAGAAALIVKVAIKGKR